MRFFVVLLFAASIGTVRSENAVSGRWEGSVQIPGRELNVIVDLAQNGGDAGAWIGSITIPGLGVKGAGLTEIAIKDSEIAFAIKDALGAQQMGPARFKGELHADGKLSGNFVQAGNRADFNLGKTGPPQVEFPPRSTAVDKELEGEWKGDYELGGYARHVTIKLVNRGAEGANADFVVIGKRTNNLPVDLVTQEGNLLSVDSHATGLGFEGRFDKSAGELKGTIQQGAIDVPLILRRAKYGIIL